MADAVRALDPDELLAHSERLRRLVAALVFDQDRAADVVQETWLAALRRGPRRGGEDGLRAWLAAVARRLAARERRGRARSARRERAAARPEESPGGPVPDALAQAELLRAVADAVLALEEPYRTALALRYLEGRSQREVAHRTGCSPEAARQRVSRGLAMLRERLDQRVGGRRAWVPAALRVAPVRRLAGGAALTGGAIVSQVLKLAVAGAAALALAVLGWWVTSPLSPVSGGSRDAEKDAAELRLPRTLVPEPLAAGAPQPGAGRRAEAAESRAPLAPAEPVEAVPSLPTAPEAAVAQAVFHVLLEHGAGAETGVRPRFRAAQNLETLEAACVPETPQQTESAAPGRYTVRVPCAARTLFEVEGVPTGASPMAQVLIQTLGWVVAGPGDVVEVSIDLSELPTGSNPLAAPPTPEEALLSELTRTQGFGAIRGRLLSGAMVEIAQTARTESEGGSAAERLARLMAGSGTLDGSYRDDDGTFLMVPVRAGRHTVRIRGTASGTLEVEADVLAGQTTDLGFLLPPEQAGILGGLVTDENGLSLAGAKVLLMEGDPLEDLHFSGRHVQTETDASGRFLFEGLDPEFRTPRVTVMPAYRLPRRNVPAEIGRTGLVIRMPKQARVYLTGFPAGVAGPGVGLECRDPAADGEGQLTEIWDSDRPDAQFLMTVDAERIPIGRQVRFRRRGGIGQPDLVGEWFELWDGALVEVRLREEGQ